MHSGGDPSALGTGNFHGNEARSPVIDPSLDISPVSPAANHKASFKVNQPAVEIVLSSTEREPSRAPDIIHSPSHVDPRSVSHHSSSASTGGSIERNETSRELTSSHDIEPPELFYATQSPPHTHTFERPPEMEHMLTEDGEPMLNPGSFYSVVIRKLMLICICKAELLTQVGSAMTAAESNVYDLMLDLLNQESLASPPPSL